MSRAECFGATSNHPGDSAPLQSRLEILQLLAFPKTKITFEREKISDCRCDSGKCDGAADGHWENCVRPQGACFEGDRGIIVLCTVYFVSSSINVTVLHITWLDAFSTDLVCFKCIGKEGRGKEGRREGGKEEESGRQKTNKILKAITFQPHEPEN